jgi:hypothetical protein
VTQVVNGRSQAVWRDVDRRKRDGQPEAPPARASWIQVEHAVDRVDLRHMGVAGDDDVDAACDRIDLLRLQIVQNVDQPSRKTNEFGVGIGNGPVAGIHVSSDRGNRGDAAKSVDDVRTPDVAAMNDVIDAGQATFRLRPQQAMRIGNNADSECHQCIHMDATARLAFGLIVVSLAFELTGYLIPYAEIV